MKLVLTALLFLTYINISYSQTIIWEEDFNSYPDGTIEGTGGKWTIDVSDADLSSSGDYFEVRNNRFQGEDINGEAVWLSESINIYDSGSFSIYVEGQGDLEDGYSGDYFDLYYKIDDEEFVLLQNWNELGSSSHTLSGEFGSTTIDYDFTGNNLELKFIIYNNVGGEIILFDDIQVFSSPPSTDTKLFFETNSFSMNEGDGSYSLKVNIENPSSTNAASADVVLTSGDAADVNNYSTQTVTFPAGSGEQQSVLIQITDDSEKEGNEDFVFELQNITGGDNASSGSPSTFTLSVMDNDLPNVVINEILADPADGLEGDANYDGVRSSDDDEFVEIVNIEDYDVDISNWSIWDSDVLRYTFPENTILPSKQSAVVFGGGSPQNIPGFVDVASSLSLNNTGGDNVYLKDETGNIVDFHGYGSEAVDNQSIGRNPDFIGEFTQHTNIRSGVLFSPGRMNSDGSSLPIELLNFNAENIEEGVLLTWETATEVNNSGFEVERKTDKSEWKKLIFIRGNGNSNSPKFYFYTDEITLAGDYTYRLKQIDHDGKYEYYDPINIQVSAPSKVELKQNIPNPFNPKTKISFSIPKISNVKLNIYNAIGQLVETLIDENMEAGTHSVDFNSSKLSSGLYIYNLIVDEKMFVRKMIVVK